MNILERLSKNGDKIAFCYDYGRKKDKDRQREYLYIPILKAGKRKFITNKRVP